MKKIVWIFSLMLVMSSCFKGKKVDLVIHNAKIHTLDETNTEYEAMAIQDGKIVEFGPERQILNKYRSKTDFDAGGKDVYPGFSDAHTHILLYAQQKLAADLSQVKSEEKAIVLLEKYKSHNSPKFIIARGFPTNLIKDKSKVLSFINQQLKDIPVFLITQDVHGSFLNQTAVNYLTKQDPKDPALKKATLTGYIGEQDFFRLLSSFPQYDETQLREKLFEIQDELLQYGIVAVHEMGLSYKDFNFLKRLTKDKRWLINISAYLLPSKENLQFLDKGMVIYPKFQVRGIKIFLDGTFGSESAAMDQAYKDGKNGVINYTKEELDSVLQFAYQHELQVAVHSAGDKSAEFFLSRIKELHLNVSNLQWRMEHLQKVSPKILKLMTNLHLIPSVQPYHAVSDAHWLNEKLTVDASYYAYRSLYNTNGILLIGSDLPIETFNPFEIIYAASTRKDRDGFPTNGFNIKEKISVLDAIKAYALYNPTVVGLDSKFGSLKTGKMAHLFVADRTISSSVDNLKNYAVKTYINGKEAYSVE